jgi:hypothetical protein
MLKRLDARVDDHLYQDDLTDEEWGTAGAAVASAAGMNAAGSIPVCARTDRRTRALPSTSAGLQLSISEDGESHADLA